MRETKKRTSADSCGLRNLSSPCPVTSLVIFDIIDRSLQRRSRRKFRGWLLGLEEVTLILSVFYAFVGFYNIIGFTWGFDPGTLHSNTLMGLGRGQDSGSEHRSLDSNSFRI